jgi:hypothetical protein
MKDRTDEVDSVIVAFRCPKDLVGAIEEQAAVESISKSDVARRAVLRDLRTTPARMLRDLQRAKMQETDQHEIR